MPKLYLTLKIIATVIGVVCFCVTTFLYEDEEGNVQSKLEAIWIRIDDLQKKAISRHLAFVQAVSAAVASFLKRLYGEKLFSVRSLYVSSCLTISLIHSFIFFLGLYQSGGRESTIYSFRTSLISLVYCLVILKVEEKKWLRVWYAGFCYWIYKSFLEYIPEVVSAGLNAGKPIFVYLAFFVVIGCGIGTIIFSICMVLFRKSLNLLSTTQSQFALIFAVCLNVSPFIVIHYGWRFLLAFLLAMVDVRKSKDLAAGDEAYINGVGLLMIFLFFCVLVIAGAFSFIATLTVLFALALFAHKLFWPLLERPIYALQRYGVIKRRTTVAGIGLALIYGAWGKLDWLDKLSEKLGAFDK